MARGQKNIEAHILAFTIFPALVDERRSLAAPQQPHFPITGF